MVVAAAILAAVAFGQVGRLAAAQVAAYETVILLTSPLHRY